MTKRSKQRWRGRLIPVEHGGWGLLLEPVALGLLVAPSGGGALLGLAAVAAYLARTPLLRQWTGSRTDRRATSIERAWAVAWAAVAALALAGVVLLDGARPLLPLALAVPFALIQVRAGLGGGARGMGAEVAGGLALSSLTPAMALAHGWSGGEAAVLWVVPALWSTLSILYVRARLRLERGQKAPVDDVLDAHGAAVVVLAGLAVAGWLPILAVAAFLLLSLRVVRGLLRRGVRTSPQQVGWAELAAGIACMVVTAVGWRGGL